MLRLEQLGHGSEGYKLVYNSRIQRSICVGVMKFNLAVVLPPSTVEIDKSCQVDLIITAADLSVT